MDYFGIAWKLAAVGAGIYAITDPQGFYKTAAGIGNGIVGIFKGGGGTPPRGGASSSSGPGRPLTYESVANHELALREAREKGSASLEQKAILSLKKAQAQGLKVSSDLSPKL